MPLDATEILKKVSTEDATEILKKVSTEDATEIEIEYRRCQ